MSRPRFAARISQSNFSVLYIILVAITKYVPLTSLGVTSPSIHEKFKKLRCVATSASVLWAKFLRVTSILVVKVSGWRELSARALIRLAGLSVGRHDEFTSKRGGNPAHVNNLPTITRVGREVNARETESSVNCASIEYFTTYNYAKICWVVGGGALSNYCFGHCLPENEVKGHLSMCIKPAGRRRCNNYTYHRIMERNWSGLRRAAT